MTNMKGGYETYHAGDESWQFVQLMRRIILTVLAHRENVSSTSNCRLTFGVTSNLLETSFDEIIACSDTF